MTKDDETADDSLSGAYVLNSLTEEERTAFEQRMAASNDLRNEVIELADTAVLLGMATQPVQPSAGLRASVLAAAARLPQLPREAEAVPATPQPVAPAAETVSEAARVVPASATPASVVPAPAVEAPARTPARRGGADARAALRWMARPVAVLIAAAAALALVFGGVLLGGLITGPTPEQQHAAAFAELNAAPDVQRMGTEVEGAGTVTLVVSQSLDLSALVWETMPELPADRVYELWYITEEAMPAGLIELDSGQNFRVLDGELPEDAQVGLTVEPNGGSEQPTTDPVLVLPTSGA
jgi:anti-sigma-K factor RskA